MVDIKHHTQDDACDHRHCRMITMEAALEAQGKVLWFILLTLIGGLIKVFFGG